MENILILSSIALSLAGIAIWMIDKARLQSFLSYLIMLLLLLFSQSGFSNETSGQKLTATLIAILSLNWILAQILHQKWRVLLGLASTVVFVFWKNSSHAYFDYPLIFDAKNALFLPLIGAAFPLILGFKSGFLAKFFGIRPDMMYRNLQVMGLGILLLASLFFAGTYGVVLVAIGYYSSEVYRNKESQSEALALFLIAFAMILLKKYNITPEAFLHGSTLVGLFIGLGIGLWIKSSERLETAPFFKKILYFLIPVLLLLVFVQLEKMKEHTGGISALSALLTTLAMVALFLQEAVQRLFLAFVACAITFSLLLTPGFAPHANTENKVLNDKFAETEEMESDTNEEMPLADTISASKDSVPVKNQLEGKWKIVSQLSSLEFELGPPETRTKGFFKTIQGDFEFNVLPGKSSVKVELPLSGFTTENTFRDESLLSEEFLSATAFPSLIFKSSSWTQNKKTIRVVGDFTMKGIKQKLALKMKIVASGKDKNGDYILISGSSTLDRTKFGMDSDPKIGDLVDFNFKLELRR